MNELPDPRTAGPIRVLIADDHDMVRAGLRMLLADEPGMEVVGEVMDGAQAFKLAVDLRPAVLIADLRMPPPDGIELARLLSAVAPEVRTIIVTAHEDDGLVRDALAAGAAAYVLKRSGPLALLQAIQEAAAGKDNLPAIPG